MKECLPVYTESSSLAYSVSDEWSNQSSKIHHKLFALKIDTVQKQEIHFTVCLKHNKTEVTFSARYVLSYTGGPVLTRILWAHSVSVAVLTIYPT